MTDKAIFYVRRKPHVEPEYVSPQSVAAAANADQVVRTKDFAPEPAPIVVIPKDDIPATDDAESLRRERSED